MLAFLILQPVFKLLEDFHPCSPQATPSVPTTVLSLNSMVHPVKEGEVCRFLSNSYINGKSGRRVASQ